MITLKLHPNPYVFVDHAGRLAGTHPVRPDPYHGGAHKVGARVSPDVVAKANPLGGEGSGVTPIVQDTTWEHDAEPFVVEHAPGDPFFPTAVRVGDLFCADKATADLLGVDFVDPAKMLAKAREKAIADWTVNHGEPPAFASDPCPVAGKPKPVAEVKPKASAPTAPAATAEVTK